MTEILRIRATWGVDGGKNYENFARWFPELKAKGYGMSLSRIEENSQSRIPEKGMT
jgi:hypothetical protein